MLEIHGDSPILCDGTTRREMLRIGGTSMAGLSLSQLLNQPANAAKPALSKKQGSSFGQAKNCIILFLSGGAAHLDTFDPKPKAPVEIRGEFDTIETALNGVRFSEYLPNTAKILDKVAVVRSMTHESAGHAPGGYIMFTGQKYLRTASQANFMSRDEAPHLGSLLAKVSPGNGPMFPFVMVPRRLDAGSGRRAGQWGGSLGSKFDPMLTGGNPNDDNFKLEHLPLVANRPIAVLKRRKRLIDQINGNTKFLQENSLGKTLDLSQQKAIDVVSSEAVRRAVDLSIEDPKSRAKYGRNLFGQSVLLGRRLLDAGTRLVQVNWLRTQGEKGYAWDSHRENFEALREDLIPPFDVAYAALLNDLEERGLLDETLVVVAGEFGRTPKVTLATAGREHWPGCFSVLLAGGGIKGGQVYGASDTIGAYPADLPTSPGDLTATILHCLGIDHQGETHDESGRPIFFSTGQPIEALI